MLETNMTTCYVRFLETNMRIIGIFIGISFFIVALVILPKAGIDEARLLSVSATMASLSGTLFGFVIAALSILSAVLERRLLKRMKKTGYYTQLINELISAATVFLIVMIVTLFSLFMAGQTLIYLMTFSIGFMAAAIGFLVIGGYHFYLVMKTVE